MYECFDMWFVNKNICKKKELVTTVARPQINIKHIIHNIIYFLKRIIRHVSKNTYKCMHKFHQQTF